MNTVNVRKGDVFSDYGTLCTALGITPKTHEGKKRQLEEIAQRIKFHTSGRKFIVDVVLQPVDDISPTYDLPLVPLAQTFNLLPRCFDSYDYVVTFREKHPEVSLDTIHQIKKLAYNKVYSLVNYKLASLAKQGKLTYTKSYEINGHEVSEEDVKNLPLYSMLLTDWGSIKTIYHIKGELRFPTNVNDDIVDYVRERTEDSTLVEDTITHFVKIFKRGDERSECEHK